MTSKTPNVYTTRVSIGHLLKTFRVSNKKQSIQRRNFKFWKDMKHSEHANMQHVSTHTCSMSVHKHAVCQYTYITYITLRGLTISSSGTGIVHGPSWAFLTKLFHQLDNLSVTDVVSIILSSITTCYRAYVVLDLPYPGAKKDPTFFICFF